MSGKESHVMRGTWVQSRLGENPEENGALVFPATGKFHGLYRHKELDTTETNFHLTASAYNANIFSHKDATNLY